MLEAFTWRLASVRMACKIIEQPRVYDANTAKFVIHDPYNDMLWYAAIRDTDYALSGQCIEIVHLFVLSAALDVVIHSYMPLLATVDEMGHVSRWL